MPIKKQTQNWFFEGREIKSLADAPPKVLGFIYRITNLTKNMTYIGRKSMMKPNYTSGKNKGLSKGEYPWKSYTGSSISLNADIKAGDLYHKEIIHWCYTKAELTYYETQNIMCSNALLDDLSYNFWIKALVYGKHLNPAKKEIK